MKIYVYPADRWGCGHYRLMFPAWVLQERGHDVVIKQPGMQRNLSGVVRRGELRSVQGPDDADVIVLQRPGNIMLSQSVHLLRASGIAVVVDVDDDLAHIHPSNPAFFGMHPKHNPNDNWVHIARACRDASLVTVSTPALADIYGSHGRVQVLENLVPAYYLDAQRAEDELVVGWAGSLHSHPNDLDDAVGMLQRIRRDGTRVRVIGSEEGVERKLGPGIEATGIIEFVDWAETVAQLGIGVAPLADTRFNRSKSWLKPLEYSALGVPWIASPSPEYEALAKLGAGVIARRPKDWYREAQRLIKDPALRKDRAAAGRDVAAGLTYELHADLWLNAWERAVTAT